MMKKAIAAVMCALMVFGLAACGSKEAAPAAAEKEEATEEAAEEEAEGGLVTVTPGKLTVATSPDFAPYEFYALDEEGNPTLAGFDLALAQYIADYAGLELEIIPMDFDGVIMELGAGRVDLGAAGLSPDPDREELMDFSDLYYLGGQSIVTVKDKADLYKSIEDVNKPEVTVGAQIGSIQVDLANENTPDANIIQLTKVTEIVAELLAGKMDCGFIETAVAESYQKNYPDLEIILDVPYDQEGSAIGVSKGNAQLLAVVNEAIAKALEDGTMDGFVAEANELASGEKYEGLLDAEGKIQE